MIKEACVETLQEAVLAEKLGADRIELCSDLANEGLTPSFHLMQAACATLKIPVMVMIRPRAGGFVYSNTDIEQMKLEINMAKKSGAAGVVFGLLDGQNHIDLNNTKMLAEYASPLPVTFHKAIDKLDDPVEGIKLLKEINGIKRILTSGGKTTAMEGVETIKKMMETAGDDLTIVVAGKVTDKNIVEVQKIT
ncbi:MAG: copper homeostasis protein CutC, partial [Draconibacterium sp.]